MPGRGRRGGLAALLHSERGVGVAAALLFILILASLGYVALALTVEDMNGASAYAASEQALGVAQAGLAFGVKKLIALPSWTGVPSPGKPAGPGSFTVAVTTTDEYGVPLTGGQKMVRATGRVGGAVRELRQLLAPAGGGSTSAHGTAQGDAVSIQSQKKYVNIGNITDGAAGPNNTWGYGGFNSSDNESGIFAGWTSPGLSGTVTKVEACLYGYLSGSLTNDHVDLELYWNNGEIDTDLTLTTAELNARVGAANKGYWYVDVTSARSWTLADFSGDLELYVKNDKQASDDGRTLYLDCVGFRVTVSGGGGAMATAFKEITS